jgi:predicted DCC family thiol-disulfide oxidoreductase YuxK
MRRFNGRGKLALEDISAPGFDPARYGRSLRELMGQIHALSPTGELLTGMEAFRMAYAAVGLGAWLAPTKWPGLQRLFDRGYEWFARNRLRLTGRHDCLSGSCAVASTPSQSRQ